MALSFEEKNEKLEALRLTYDFLKRCKGRLHNFNAFVQHYLRRWLKVFGPTTPICSKHWKQDLYTLKQIIDACDKL